MHVRIEYWLPSHFTLSGRLKLDRTLLEVQIDSLLKCKNTISHDKGQQGIVWPFATGRGSKKHGKVSQEGANMGPYKMCNVAHMNIKYQTQKIQKGTQHIRLPLGFFLFSICQTQPKCVTLHVYMHIQYMNSKYKLEKRCVIVTVERDNCKHIELLNTHGK